MTAGHCGAISGFVDELFRLGLVDAEKRDFLHRGLAGAGRLATRAVHKADMRPGIRYRSRPPSARLRQGW